MMLVMMMGMLHDVGGGIQTVLPSYLLDGSLHHKPEKERERRRDGYHIMVSKSKLAKRLAAGLDP